jgi:hypothetical protein
MLCPVGVGVTVAYYFIPPHNFLTNAGLFWLGFTGRLGRPVKLTYAEPCLNTGT